MTLLFYLLGLVFVHLCLLNLTAMTLRPGEIIVFGEKETPFIRLVQLGWLLGNHILFLGLHIYS